MTERFVSTRRLVIRVVLAACAGTLLFSLATAEAAVASPGPAGHQLRDLGRDLDGSILVDGLVRTYTLHVPATPRAPLAPLLLVFHGRGELGTAIESFSGFDEVSDTYGFFVVYPQGIANSWNDGRGTTPAEAEGVNDVDFTRALVKKLEHNWPLDPSRIYAAGFSNGGMLAERLGCAMAGRLAAIASVSGPLAAPLAGSCAPHRPLPELAIEGTTDPVVPYGGGSVESTVGGDVLSAEQVTTLWASDDGCGSSPISASLPAAPNDGTGVDVVRYGHCANGSAVELASVLGGVHTWPGGAPAVGTLPRSFANTPYYATDAIWAFLRVFRLATTTPAPTG